MSRDYAQTLFLPKTDFPMKAGLPQKEPEILARWQAENLYCQLRKARDGAPKYILHDGPPYANGNIHIGHALNKILKDIVVRARSMEGYDAPYVPGWDCHGLPIEWKIEESYRNKGKNKDDVPVLEFREECRRFAAHWMQVQSEEFQRLGVLGAWDKPYATMTNAAEATIAKELMDVALSGQLYRGSKPVMWSVVEKTALAEAEIEYKDKNSPTIWVKFPLIQATSELLALKPSLVIWTTTPWTLPANRAIAYGPSISYSLFRIDDAGEAEGVQTGEHIIVADALVQIVMQAAKVASFTRLFAVDMTTCSLCAHPFRGAEGAKGYYDFGVPVLPTDYVTDDAGTGFVHTAPGHGADDYGCFLQHRSAFEAAGTPRVPDTVAADGHYYPHVTLFEGARVFDDKGREGDANGRVIAALAAAGKLAAKGRITHAYPHSWRSKAPVIFRNTPQWFIAMGDQHGAQGLRAKALKTIEDVNWVPAFGQRRLSGMVESRPDWVISRQRAWGVPITVFVESDGYTLLQNKDVNARIVAAFEAEGADAWYKANPRRFLEGLVPDPSRYEPITDILDVWFESGVTHSFVLESGNWPDLTWPADLYLEGSDQHRGWFQSSLLASVSTRGQAPFKEVLTHGFVLDEKGDKMSKSLGNVVAPQKIMETHGADILRLWVAASDYSDDLRIGPEIIKTFSETYRKIRNTLRWMLGTLAHHDPAHAVHEPLPELEQLLLHRLTEVGQDIAKAYKEHDFKRVVAVMNQFMSTDLSAFYVDIRKDTLYCEAKSSVKRRASLTVLDEVFHALTTWLAPILCFTAEEAWGARNPHAGSVHVALFKAPQPERLQPALAEKWNRIREVRRVITGAIEKERAAKTLGSSLEAAPQVFIQDPKLQNLLASVDMAEVCITSGLHLIGGEGPDAAFRLADVPGVSVVVERAEGKKCARSWRITQDVGADPAYPDISARDALAMAEWDADPANGANLPDEKRA